jgi:DNA-binding SARP family transcriptional activator/tetratricopeptide (TPR) repeat protein
MDWQAVTVMDFLLLGSLEARHHGELVPLGRRRSERCLLGLLLLDAGRVVAVDRLADLLWDEEPPPNARAIIQTHVARLRSVLDPERTGDSGARLVRRGEGYVVEIAPGSTDVHRFRSLVERGRALRDPDRRALDLRAALACWRGPLLADVASDRLRDRVGTGLNELRLSTLEDCVAAELESGRHRDLIVELTDLVETHTRERLATVLMVALYRDGRQADALGVYQHVRTRLADELGLDPSAELAGLRDAILRNDPSLDRPPGRAPIRVEALPTVPAQLPAPPGQFTGRLVELETLDRLVDDEKGISPVVITAVAGTAGVGKTALALHWAHRVRHQFPDGQLHVNFRGFEPTGVTVPTTDVLRRFLDALGTPAHRIPGDLDAQAALYRTLLADRRMLVVLDNVRDADQVRPLLPGTASAVVLITSRNDLSGLVAVEGALPLPLDLLTRSEARALLARRIGEDRISAEPDAVDDIIDRCARLPLALAIVAARAARHGQIPLATLAGELRDTRARLDALTTGDATSDLRAVFSWSYRALTPPAARMFRLLGLHPGPDISAEAAASLVGGATADVAAQLAELTRASLVLEPVRGRYAFHDLLRSYARELAHEHEPSEQRSLAEGRMLDHYVHSADAASRGLEPDTARPLPETARPGVVHEEHQGPETASAWFTIEREVLLAVFRWASDQRWETEAAFLARTLSTFLDRQCHYADLVDTQRFILDVARRRGDHKLQMNAHHGLAAALTGLGRHDDAYAVLEGALAACRGAGDERGEATTCHFTGFLLDRQGRHREALDQVERAVTLYRAVGGQSVRLGRALNAVAWCHTRLGDHRQAVEVCREALSLMAEHGDSYGQIVGLDTLGYAHHQLGEYQEAISCYRQALTMQESAGERISEANVLNHLGDARAALGDVEGAQDCWQRALDIFDDIDHPDAVEIRAKLRATRPVRQER